MKVDERPNQNQNPNRQGFREPQRDARSLPQAREPEVKAAPRAEPKVEDVREAREVAEAVKITRAVVDTEVVEPVRLGATESEAPPERILFRNPHDFDVIIQAPERMMIPRGKASNFPAGYHRAIHRQSPHLVCEHGRQCKVSSEIRGNTSEEEREAFVAPQRVTGDSPPRPA